MAASESIWFRSTPHPRIPPRPTLNGEGIDYGLETGRLVAELLADERHLGSGWPAILRRHYGEAFSIARRLAGLLTLPRLLPVAGPVGMRSRALMTVALRVMGNLVTDEESASGPPSAASRCTSNARWTSPMRARSLTPMSCRSGRCWCSGLGCRAGDRAADRLALLRGIGVFATNLDSAEGTAVGVRQAGKTNQVKIVNFDAGPNQVKDLRANTIQALVAQEPALSPMLLLPGRGGLVVVAVGLTRR